MKFCLAIVAFLLSSAMLHAQEYQYGRVKILIVPSSSQTQKLAQQLGDGIQSLIMKEKKIRSIGEPVTLVSEPSDKALRAIIFENKADELALVRTESGDEKYAVFTVELIDLNGAEELAKKIVQLGTVALSSMERVSRSIYFDLIAFASKSREMHVILELLTIPPKCSFQVGESDMLLSRDDGVGIFDGTRPVGNTNVSIQKGGYRDTSFSFEVKPTSEGRIRVYRRVVLDKVASP
jgi:hypothetical protein